MAMPLGHPPVLATSCQSPPVVILKIRPCGMSVTYRLPALSKDGPSRKQSTTWPGLLASAQSLRTERRKASGMRVHTRASITSGGVKLRFHMVDSLFLFGLHTRCVNQFTPTLRFIPNRFLEVWDWNAAWFSALLGKAFEQVWRRKCLFHLSLKLVDDWLGGAFRRGNAKPVGRIEIFEPHFSGR